MNSFWSLRLFHNWCPAIPLAVLYNALFTWAMRYVRWYKPSPPLQLMEGWGAAMCRVLREGGCSCRDYKIFLLGIPSEQWRPPWSVELLTWWIVSYNYVHRTPVLYTLQLTTSGRVKYISLLCYYKVCLITVHAKYLGT